MLTRNKCSFQGIVYLIKLDVETHIVDSYYIDVQRAASYREIDASSSKSADYACFPLVILNPHRSRADGRSGYFRLAMQLLIQLVIKNLDIRNYANLIHPIFLLLFSSNYE